VINVYAIFDAIPSARIVGRIIDDSSLLLAAAEVRSSAIMMTCGALIREATPAVLVLDSDSLEDRVMMVDRVEIGGILDRCHGRIPYRLILAIPQVEAILFSDRAGFEKALGRKVADLDWFEARFRPRAVFRRLLGDREFEEGALAVIDALDEPALRRMARHSIVREIRSFMAEVQAPAKRARVRRAG
jgi:hypothetical protein